MKSNNKKNYLLILISSILFLIFYFIKLNHVSYLIFHSTKNNSSLLLLIKAITLLGNPYVILMGTLTMIILLRKNKFYSFLLTLNMILVTLITYLFKIIFSKPRPDFLINTTGYSFPSAHASISLTFYLLTTYFYYNLNLPYKKTILSLGIILPILIGLSRVFLGVHWLGDIIAGFLLSSILILITMILIKNKNL